MRIAFFSPHSDPLAEPGAPDSGGQCVYEEKVIGALAQAGHEVRCYTRRYGDKPAYQPLYESAAVYRMDMGPEGFLRKEDMGPHLAEFTHWVLKQQKSWLESADIFHGHYWDGGVAALQTSLALGKPLLFTSHSLGALKKQRVPDPSPDGSVFHYDIRISAERRVMKACDSIIALSEVERQALLEHYDVPASKIHIVPGGVSIEAYTPKASKAEFKQQLGLETDFLVFTTGRLDPRKGFVELIATIPHVRDALQKSGKTVTFMLPAGPEKLSVEEAAYKSEMETTARALGVYDTIHWFNRLSEEQLYLRFAAADVFCCPSPYEPFGLVVVEAFASGTPVVATSHGGPVEIIEQGKTGYLAEPGDAKAFAAPIIDILLADEAQRSRMGEVAMRTAREHYAWQAVAGQIAEVYTDLL